MLRLTLILILSFSFSLSLFSQDTSKYSLFDVIYLESNVSTLQDSVRVLNSKIKKTQKSINSINKKLISIKSAYTSYKEIYSNLLQLYFIYKLNYENPVIFIFSSATANKLYNRVVYYKILIKFIRNLHSYIHLLENQLVNQETILKDYKQSLFILINKSQQTTRQIDSVSTIIAKELIFLQQNSDKIRKTINTEYKNFEVIHKMIYKNLNNDTTQCNFVFHYPLKNSVIISSFGKHDHPYLKGVTIKNDGIDIYSKTDSIVKASAEGIVTSIVTLPSHTQAILIQHSQFYSVYSYVKNPVVAVGDTVFSGQAIAFVDNNYDKYKFPVLNFQLWKKTDKLNPVKYLVKK